MPVPDARPIVLAARGIRKSFGGVEVLHGVDFTLRRGQVHGLVGQNGAGKSTLVKIIDGAYVADEGDVEVNGVPVEGPRRAGHASATSRWCSRSSASSPRCRSARTSC